MTRFVSEALAKHERAAFCSGHDLADRYFREPPDVPIVLIGWMGRELAFRGTVVGSMLLYDAISRVAKAPVGAYAIGADAINDVAAACYRDHQYQPLVSRPHTLFLPLKTAQAPVKG